VIRRLGVVEGQALHHRVASEFRAQPVDRVFSLGGAPVEHGGAITMLNNGDQFVPVLLDAIAHAKRTINFAVYIWAEGAFSDQLLAALEPPLPTAMGVLYCNPTESYEHDVYAQQGAAAGKGDLDALLNSERTWEVS